MNGKGMKPKAGYNHHAYSEGYSRIADYTKNKQSQEQNAAKEQKKLDTSIKISSTQSTPN